MTKQGERDGKRHGGRQTDGQRRGERGKERLRGTDGGGRTREQVSGKPGSQAPRSPVAMNIIGCESIFLAPNGGGWDPVISKGPADSERKRGPRPSGLARP